MKISALDENGKPVDWWFIYKVPKLNRGANNDKTTGYEYVYYDANLDKAGKNVGESSYTLDGDKGALNLTLDSVFNKPDATTGWVIYNDETPVSTKIKDDHNLGHTKGVIAFDTKSKTAYWLLHSWPKFVDPGSTKEPTPEYGQTYLCLSLNIDVASQIAAQMANHQEPQVYNYQRANLKNTDPLYILTQPINSSSPADSNVLDLNTQGGMPFKVIAKNRKWGKDFWNDLVGPALKQDMDIETWIRGKVPPISDVDGIHKTFDIKYVDLGSLGIHLIWPETHDHAKWGITVKDDWVCIGDINRMISQRQRGGGTIAFRNETLWRALWKTSLILAPPGHTRMEAHDLIQSTHVHPDASSNAQKSSAKAKSRKSRKTSTK